MSTALKRERLLKMSSRCAISACVLRTIAPSPMRVGMECSTALAPLSGLSEGRRPSPPALRDQSGSSLHAGKSPVIGRYFGKVGGVAGTKMGETARRATGTVKGARPRGGTGPRARALGQTLVWGALACQRKEPLT